MAEDQAPDGHLVVIGASAGGIEALSTLAETLQADFAAPIVVAQHLDPNRESHLGDILARRSRLPVVTVEDQSSLEPGRVYVIPPNRHLRVTDHEVRLLEPTGNDRPIPSINRLFSSAAEQFGERLVAVILSGTGSDGAEGARQVKRQGGTVVVQDPETAKYPGMPSSLAPTTVDITASIDAIGPLLHELVSGTRRLPSPEDDRELTTFLAELRQQSGIDFAAYKRATIQRRLERRLLATGSSDLRAYVRHARRNPEEFERLTSSFLIKVTEFFRDAELFDRLRDVIVPALIADARDRGRELRVWSAGCATGEEAYSLAMLISDALGDQIEHWTVRIFATDLDRDAIAFARRGIYPAGSLDHLPQDLVQQHFVRRDGEYEVKPHIRGLTVFGQHDLALRAPFPRTDLVLCRNVLIYFTPELQRRALQLFAFSLRDGGWLALGKAETTTPLAQYFVVEDSRLKLFRRRGERLLVPPVGTERTTGAAPTASVFRQVRGAVTSRPSPGRAPAGLSAEKADGVLGALPFGVVSVDATYDIRAINPAARRMLGIHGAAIGQDIVHLADRVPTGSLRRALDDAFAGRTATVRMELASAPSEDAPTWLEIVSVPAKRGPGHLVSSGAIVTVRDITTEITGARKADADLAAERGSSGRGLEQIEALRELNRRLMLDNDELATANAELRAANQEQLVANEEVQAASEEVETLNEELQATNEELETLNEELQATVEELNTTNDDMQARAVELQDLTISLEDQRRTAETERARLATLIETLRDGVLVLDRSGRTVFRNEAFARMMLEDEGRQAEEAAGVPLDIEALHVRVAAGSDFVLPFYVTGEDGRRRWYEAYARPIPAAMGLGEGGVLVVHDTTDVSLRRLQEEFVGIVAHELRTPLTALRGYLQMLARRGVDQGERPVLPLAIDQANRLQRLVEELFDVSRVERGVLTIKPERIDLGDVIDQTIEIAEGIADRHRFTVVREDGGVSVTADPGRLQQVILNLLMNAMVHAPDAPDVEVRTRRLRRRVEIEIEDHGPGIPPDMQAILFAPFVQGRASAVRSGLGLGLYIAREIVVAHGGTIDVDSAQGEGTTFTIRLPLQAASPAAAHRVPARDAGRAAGRPPRRGGAVEAPDANAGSNGA